MGSQVKILILTVAPKAKNKTARYMDRIGVDDYVVMIPDTNSELAESYGDNAYVYSTDEARQYVDFCGSNLTNGAAVAREASTLYAKKFNCDCLVFDDDYNGVGGNFAKEPSTGYDKDDLYNAAHIVKEMMDKTGFDVGGYSAGAHPYTRFSIMQIFYITPQTPSGKFRMIFNEDVCSGIEDWQHGIACFGLGEHLRSSGQTAEMTKATGNRAFYETDMSYRKSFGSVLQDPLNAKLTTNKTNKNKSLWHHEIQWKNICPKIVLED